MSHNKGYLIVCRHPPHILDVQPPKVKDAHQQMISTIFTNAMLKFTNLECLETKQGCKCPKPVAGILSLPSFEVQEEVGFVSEFPPLVSQPYNPATPQCEMSAVSSKEIRKERGRRGRFQQCLPQKQRLMTTDSMSSLCLESEIVT
jgi:hypothetical protein